MARQCKLKANQKHHTARASVPVLNEQTKDKNHLSMTNLNN
jgi:hypothetical protein